MKKILNVLLPVVLVGCLYFFLKEFYFIQHVYENQYEARFELFSTFLQIGLILVTLVVGYLYMKTDRVKWLDRIFGLIPSIVLLVPLVLYCILRLLPNTLGAWLSRFLNWTGAGLGGKSLLVVFTDHRLAFALTGLTLLLAYLFRPKKKVPEEDEDDDYLDDLPPVKPAGKRPSQKPAPKEEIAVEKPETAPAAPEAPADPVTPTAPAEPDPIYAEAEPVSEPRPETPANGPIILEMPEAAAPTEPETTV